MEKNVNSMDQVVFMGAGFDTRAFKYCEGKNIKVFELDKENTQNCKIMALKKAGIDYEWITFIPIDFNQESWVDKLIDHGFDTSKKTFFLWEGVTLYLDEESVKQTLRAAAKSSGKDSVITWSPELIVNLGTCGGIKIKIERGRIILSERTIIYNIVEQMGDIDKAIAHYSTNIDLSWLGDEYPYEVYKTTILSGDRDIVAEDIPFLNEKYTATVADWESGSIAWVCNRNRKKCLILRGVTDLVDTTGGEAYDGNIQVFRDNAIAILARLIKQLPEWLLKAR